MPKWIELNTGEIENLDMVCNIRKYKTLLDNTSRRYRYEIEYRNDSDTDYECFNDESERDKRFDEIKAMLIGDDGK